MKNTKKSDVFDWVKVVGFALVMALFINNGLIVNATIPSASMASTIMVGDRIIANRLAYIKEEPQRGDIVTFISHEDDDAMYVKRLIGLPGDSIEITEGKVFVNGIQLKEDYLNNTLDVRTFGSYEVPDDAYFFLGDNRKVSKDSRLWHNPYIKEEDIKGKVVLRVYPDFRVYP